MPDQAFAKLLQFIHLNPGAGFFLVAVLMVVGRKVARHFWGGSKYTFRDLKKYPFEALELGMILLALVLSVYFLFFVG